MARTSSHARPLPDPASLAQNSLSLLARTFESLPGTVEGTGFGIMGVFLNTGLILVPPLVGAAAELTGSYLFQNVIYMVALGCGLVVSLLMALLPGGAALNSITPEGAEKELV